MSLLEVIQLIGYCTGAALHLWMGALLLRRRRNLERVERVLLALTCALGVWHASNLFIALHGALGLDRERWIIPLRLAVSLAVISITLSYSFLLHVHLYLWARARHRPLTLIERVRIYLSYIPALFLFKAVPHVWRGSYAPMLDKLSLLTLPLGAWATYTLAFSLWAIYGLGFVAVTDLLIARQSSEQSERRLLRTLALSFFGIGALIFTALVLGVGKGTTLSPYLQTLTNLGSLLPTALIAYYIYRYRYLELIIQESLVVASFAAVVLAVYLYGIRTIGAWLTARYGLRAGAIEALLILGLALSAAPLRGWLERRFHKLFEREAALYREVVASIGGQAGRYRQLPELLRFVEERATESLGLRRVRLIARSWPTDHQEGAQSIVVAAHDNGDEREDLTTLADKILELLSMREWQAIEGERILREGRFELAYPLRRENRTVGLMLVDGSNDALTADARVVLEVLAGQAAIAIEDCRLVEENVQLERRLAQGERLAALGQMAATVAHEVKNPLSAIKSIAQVMREDESLADEYSRDLSLIVGETDRLSRSVTQLLSFARHAPPDAAPCRADDLARSVVALFRADAAVRNINIECSAGSQPKLNGAQTSVLRDALTNLLLNALQATPAGGRVALETRTEGDQLLVSVVDSGAGVPGEIAALIWEPFFTTRQRGTGLGLAIVRRRIEELGGSARLAARRADEGARFELRVPIKDSLES